ncbi:polymorphic toxin-type HINT domain-containing protein [Streptomyces sp. NPDC087420]|uniref:polymorphic toxin-type HINT domain-containing protein n=1 Tax=Streptomyces sp. NPDC087420 TaxID=3365785 RepID=UPI00383916D0
MGGTGVGLAGKRLSRRAGLWIVAVTAGAIAATGLTAAPASWATEHQGHRSVALAKVAPGTAVPFKAAGHKKADPATGAAAERTAKSLAQPVTWPSAQTTTLAVTAKDKPAVRTPVGHLPVSVSPPKAGGTKKQTAAPAKVSVKTATRDQALAAGIKGALLSVVRADGSAASASTDLSLDYSGFAGAYGGDYASRLALVRLPACALTTPAEAKCQVQTPLKTANDVEHHTLTATVALPAAPVSPSGPASPSGHAAPAAAPTVLAATADTKSGAGSYQATSLSPSASWAAGSSSGDFNWSYPLTVPPSAGGPSPSLALAYDAQSVDGRLPSTNNQPSWVGEGFDLTTSFIERSYDSCEDDGQKDKHDECWANDNATLTLGGKSTPLIKDKTTGAWHPKDDDGERIVRSTGASNGDNDGEFWTVTTTDGTQYVFGKNRLPGWTTGAAETNSTWTAPVFGDDTGEDCHAATFAASACTQAWRWNLDYVVDVHGNAMSYWYTKETNFYAKNGVTAPTTVYDRGGYLKRIDYGITGSTVFGTAPDQVTFTTAERCLTTSTETCSSPTTATAKDWPDVPFDQICASTAACTGNTGPTFFSRKRLTTVATQVWDASLATPAYRPVDSWALDQSFPSPGDGTSAGLWLKSITRTGKDGGSTAMPPVTFGGVQLFNRVDTTHDDIAALVKWRVRTITSETGSVLTVTYSDTQCAAGTKMPGAPDSDTMRCFPSYWQPPFTPDVQLDWFHKYVVTQINESDPTGGAPLKETDYTYNGDPAWHYDTDNVTAPAKRKTWSVWRGYGGVTTTTGNDQSTRTKTVDTYFQGMDGDKQSDGTTRSHKVTDTTGASVADSDELAGTVRESVTYNGAAEVGGTITDQWIHRTADDGTRTAAFTRPAAVRNRTDLVPGGGLRTTTATTTYDPATGEATQVDDSGDDKAGGDEQCTRTTLVNNDTAWLRGVPVRVETVDVGCSEATSRPADVISDSRSLYDGQPFGTAPTKGEQETTQRLASYSGTTPSYQTVSTTAYDTQGRVLSVTDAGQNKTTTSYVPPTGGPLTSSVTLQTVATKPFKTTTAFDPARGVATSVTDPNNKRTGYAYDALGRLKSLWLPNRDQTDQSASLVYTYQLSNTAASVVTTGKLNNDGSTYDTTYALYDGLLRPRQSQIAAPGGGRIMTQSVYDSRGLEVEADTGYTDTQAPSGTLANITSAVPSQTLTTYDGAGRATSADFYANGTKKWTSTTAYGGDRVTTTPPDGGTVTTTLTDTLGRTTETRQYDSASLPAGPHSTITYDYDAKSRLKEVQDNDGNTWSYGYDLMGRQTSATDPDAGTTTTTYNDLDQVASTQHAQDTPLSYTYDELGRRTGMFDGTVQDPDHQLARWTFDSLAKGQPTSSIRYVGGAGTSGKAYISQVGAYDDLYRPTVTRVTIPSVAGEEALAGSYTSNTGYNLDGTVQVTGLPKAGGLPSESLEYGYNSLGMPTTLQGATGLVQNTAYTSQGDVQQVTLGVSSSAKWLQISDSYENGTRRLSRQLVTGDVGGAPVQDTHYTYDDAGNPTQVATHADGTDDVQCYRYDGHDRLTQAWTATNACATDPSAAVLGGPAPYWQTYDYDALGNRTTAVDHGTASGAGDTTTAYRYPDAGTTRPHTLTSSTTTKPDGTASDASYTYDSSGNTHTRTVDGETQTLDWDDEGHLSKATNADSSSASYLYDADGNRLLTRDNTGTTLYVGTDEIHLAKGATTPTGTRYYSWGGQTIAVRTSTGSLQWQVTDGHNTAETAVDATTQAVTRRYLDPFGNARGPGDTAGDWLGDKGFVNGITDTVTGYTHLGAREYDPTTGRFISVDPVLELTDAQQINGYTYAADNPVTGSDPTGLMQMMPNGGGNGKVDDSGNLVDKGSNGGGSGGGSGSGSGSGGGGGGSTHHSCGWSLSCHVSSIAHKTYHEIQKHPVIAIVIATAVVVAVVVACTACVLAAGAEAALAFTGAAEAGAGIGVATATGAAAGAAELGMTSVLATTGATALAKVAVTSEKAEAGAAAGAQAAKATADSTSRGGAAKAATRAEKSAPRSGSSPSGCTHSFLPATRVLLADGKTKEIKDVRAGDKVKATDPETGKSQARTVEKLITTKDDKDFATITIRDGAKTSTISATVTHPFWVATTHSWIDAGRLKPRMSLRTAAGGTALIQAVHVWHHPRLTHDLTIKVTHTYYVLAGATPVLVHNCGGGTTVYRGVAEVSGETGGPNPAFDDAVEGIATPRGGDSTPEMHHLGMTDSDYTSWTTSPAAAVRAASRGGGSGVVIRATIPSGRFHVHVNDQPWVEGDLRGEAEVIIQGVMQGRARAAWPGARPEDLGF